MKCCTLSLATLFLLLATACRKDRPEVEYREQSREATAEAVTEVFAGSKGIPTGEIDPAMENFFLRLGRATREPGLIELDQLLSIDGMLAAMDSAGMFDGLEGAKRRGFEKGFRQGSQQIGNSLQQMAYDAHKIMRMEAPSEKERVVFVQHYDNEINVTFPMRWWLTETEAGWRIYDYEDLSIGLRTVQLMGLLMKAGMADNPEPWVDAFIPIAQSMQTLDFGDPEQLAELEEPLEKLRAHEMPESIQRFASTMMVSVYQVTERNEEALAELEAARDGGYASPMWHYQMAGSLADAERYEEAVAALEKHSEVFGWDSDSLEALSDAYFQLDRMEEARDAAMRGLDDNPGAPFCLASYAAASTPEQLRAPETADLFAAGDESELGYETALDYLIDLELMDEAEALYDGFRTSHPDSELHEYYVEIFALEAEEPSPAE